MEGSRLDLEKPIEDAISRIRFAPESSNLLISSWDSVLRLYDVDESVMRLEAHSEGALLDCCFRDGLTALSAGSDGCVRRFDLCSNTQTIVGKHDDSAIYVEYSEQTGYAVGSVDGCVDLKYFDPAKDSEMGYAFWCHPKSKDRSSHLVAVNDIKFHPRTGLCSNESFVTGDNEGHAIIWNADSRKRLFELGKYPNSVASLAFDQAGQFLAVASSHTHQEANEREEVPQIFIHKFENLAIPGSSG